MKKYNVIIIGCGVAGLVTAIRLSESLDNILVITKEKDPLMSNSFHAQGGIIYRGETDSWDILKQDIVFAGAGLSKEDAVGVLCDYGEQDVKEFLIEKVKVPFCLDGEGKLDLTAEGAHSQRRIIHCNDNTGEVITRHLYNYAIKRSNIEFLTNNTVLDIITSDKISNSEYRYGNNKAYGVYVLDNERNSIKTYLSNFTILATGGCGNIYKHTTNPNCATGDGYAIAGRAGAKIMNMEFTQFHPTALYHQSGERFLISESVRGEGGILRTKEGDPFMKKFHKLKDLAPRDIVSRAILDIMIKNKVPCVFLDCSSIGKEELKRRFPHIYKTCLEKYHFDITKSWIPVTPAFHFMCGGVKTDIYGRTDVESLYAVGEVACTGLHGANRLASTSLLEGLVFGIQAAEDIIQKKYSSDIKVKPLDWLETKPNKETLDPIIAQHLWEMLKNTTWNYLGPTRSKKRLKLAFKSLYDIDENIDELFLEYKIDKSLIELKNAVETALYIAKAVKDNKKSSGCHYFISD